MLKSLFCLRLQRERILSRAGVFLHSPDSCRLLCTTSRTPQSESLTLTACCCCWLCVALSAGRAKYRVQDVVRTNLACDDTAFNCVIQTQDEEGQLGVRLNKDIVQVC